MATEQGYRPSVDALMLLLREDFETKYHMLKLMNLLGPCVREHEEIVVKRATPTTLHWVLLFLRSESFEHEKAMHVYEHLARELHRAGLRLTLASWTSLAFSKMFLLQMEEQPDAFGHNYRYYKILQLFM